MAICLYVSVVDSGWIASISMIRTNLAVAVVMMVVAGFFTVNAVLAVILLKMVRYCKSFTTSLIVKETSLHKEGLLSHVTIRTFTCYYLNINQV